MDDNGRRTVLGAMIGLGAAAAAATGAQAQRRPGARSGADMAARLDAVESRATITEVLHAYARGNDRLDEAMLRGCFWPESTHHHGKFEGSSTDFIGFALKILNAVKYTAHHISNVSIAVDGDRAFTECYYFAHHRRDRKEGDEEDALFEGRYLDAFERRGGVWKIIRRRGLSDWSPPAIPAATTYAEWPAGQHSLRYPADDYYAMLTAFKKG